MTDPVAPSTAADEAFGSDIADRFLSMVLIAEILLVAATWPLWTSINRFPAVPLLKLFSTTPVIVDQCLTGILCLASLAGVVAAWRTRRPPAFQSSYGSADRLLTIGSLTAIFAGISLVLLNQHRLQPWHWLFLLILLQSLLVRRDERRDLFRLTVATIYLFAALSRLGPDVDDGMSRQVLAVLTKSVGQIGLMKNDSFVFAACLCMTLTELLAGIALLIPRLRAVGISFAVGIHVILILVLSPLGLHHHWGVLVWNGFCLVGVPVLFWERSHKTAAADHQPMSFPAKALVGFVVAFPLSGLLGLADNWMAWQLYSPRPEVVRVFINEAAIPRLPVDVTPFVDQPAPLDVWCPVRVDRWSLASTSAPLYPEDRFQMAVVAQLVNAVGGSESLRIVVDAPGMPVWWKRRQTSLEGGAINLSGTQFVFNGSVSRTSGWNDTRQQ